VNKDISVKQGTTILRAKLMGFEHPSGEWQLVEYYLPVNNRKVGWAHRSCIMPANFKNLLGVEVKTYGRNFFQLEFLKRYKFNFSQSTPIDMFGYVYLNDKEQEDFWEKFKLSPRINP
jgi:hypothetical protein